MRVKAGSISSFVDANHASSVIASKRVLLELIILIRSVQSGVLRVCWT